MADKKAEANATDGAAAEAAAEKPAAAEPAPPPVKEMRSITLTGYGGLRMVKVQNKPEATPKEGEVLVKVKACGLNFSDLVVRQGAIDNPPKTPFVMGFECAGEIVALGENVENYAVGDKVIALSNYNAWAELLAIPAQFVFKMPSGMSFQDGAALCMNYVTAYVMLFDIGNLRKGQSVLVHSAGGGVGHAVCQLCKSVEDVTIFGTASYGKHDSIKNNLTHLFDHVVDYCQEIRKVSPEGVDIVLDSLCGDDTNKGIGLLKPLGKYILYGSANIVTGETKSFFSFAKSWWQVDKVNPIKLYDENKTISGFNLRQLLYDQGRGDYVRDIVNKLFKMYAEGKIRPQVDSAWALEDIGDAMQKMHDRKNIGKILLDPSLQPKVKSTSDSPAESSGGDAKETKKEGAAAE